MTRGDTDTFLTRRLSQSDYLSLPPTRQVFFIVGVLGGRGRAGAEICALLDVRWSSAHLVQCELDDPSAGLGLTRYITWVQYGCLLIAWIRPESLVRCNVCQWRHHLLAGWLLYGVKRCFFCDFCWGNFVLPKAWILLFNISHNGISYYINTKSFWMLLVLFCLYV